jgi:hypothetical protein
MLNLSQQSQIRELHYIMNEPAYFHVAFRPNIKLISPVRRFVSEFYVRILTDRELASRLTLATHELVENAVAYAADGETEIRIEVVDDGLVVKTWNRASLEQQAVVRDLIETLNAAEDPDAFYQLRLAQTARRPEGSGLGLARIRAEADMDISLQIEDDRVCILAEAQRQPTDQA